MDWRTSWLALDALLYSAWQNANIVTPYAIEQVDVLQEMFKLREATTATLQNIQVERSILEDVGERGRELRDVRNRFEDHCHH
jgi:hypothetical protein